MPAITILGDHGLRFLAEMSAANAHEIKNALAVINENAGLLTDLVLSAEQGGDLDPERLKRIAGSIRQQVLRADTIAKSTNQMAHSVEKTHGPSDLSQSLALVKTMAMRFATKRHIGIEVVPSKSTITLPVQPFMLLHLLWLCLQCAMGAENAEKTFQVTTQKTNDKTIVRYGPLSHLEKTTVPTLVSTLEVNVLLQLVNGRIEADFKTNDLVLIFEKQAGADGGRGSH